MKTTRTIITTVCLLMFLIAVPANAQWGSKKVKGNGKVVTKDRKTGDYDGVGVAGSFDVELVSGTEGNLVIKAEENLIEYIQTDIKDNKLRIRTKKGYNLRPGSGKKIIITVPFQDISSVSLAGSGDVITKSAIRADSFRASLAGSGDIDLEINASKVKSSVAGSGDIKLRGSTTDFECSVAGSGDIHAFNLKAQNVEAKVSGSGDVRVHCDGSLKARVAGSGDITYKGDPKKEDSKASGSGSISKG